MIYQQFANHLPVPGTVLGTVLDTEGTAVNRKARNPALREQTSICEADDRC